MFDVCDEKQEKNKKIKNWNEFRRVAETGVIVLLGILNLSEKHTDSTIRLFGNQYRFF